MWKRRRTWLLLLAVIGLTFAFLYESVTHVGRGWVRGEAFYDGRPTSYWAVEIQQWEVSHAGGSATGWYETYSRRPRWTDQFFPETEWPKLLDGNPDGVSVLRELQDHLSPKVQDWARIGIQRIENGENREKGPHKSGSTLPDT